MRIAGRWSSTCPKRAARHGAHRRLRTDTKTPGTTADQLRQTTGRDLTGGKHWGQCEESLAVRPGDRARSVAKPDHIRPGPVNSHITGGNDAKDYCNEANEYEPAREAGE
jgi:hypothetical protein